MGGGDLACHDGGLSGWIRILFPEDLCFVYEREHDKYRPQDWPGRIPSAIAIVFFATGSFLGNVLTQSKFRHSHRLVFSLIAIFLAIVSVLHWSGLSAVNTEIVFLCLSMGMANPALSKIGAEAVSVTFVTGSLSRLGGYLASAAAGKPLKEAQGPIATPLFRKIADSYLSRAWVEATIWSAFLVGAVLAGIAGSSDFRTWALLPPMAVMLALSLFSSVD